MLACEIRPCPLSAFVRWHRWKLCTRHYNKFRDRKYKWDARRRNDYGVHAQLTATLNRVLRKRPYLDQAAVVRMFRKAGGGSYDSEWVADGRLRARSRAQTPASRIASQGRSRIRSDYRIARAKVVLRSYHMGVEAAAIAQYVGVSPSEVRSIIRRSLWRGENGAGLDDLTVLHPAFFAAQEELKGLPPSKHWRSVRPQPRPGEVWSAPEWRTTRSGAWRRSKQ